MATYSSILAYRIPWTEEPGGASVHGVAKNQTWLRHWACRPALVSKVTLVSCNLNIKLNTSNKINDSFLSKSPWNYITKNTWILTTILNWRNPLHLFQSKCHWVTLRLLRVVYEAWLPLTEHPFIPEGKVDQCLLVPDFSETWTPVSRLSIVHH